MKIAVYTAPKNLEIQDIPGYGSLKPNQIRVKSLYSGISHGTEMGVYRGVAPFFSKSYNGETRLFEPAPEQDTWQYPIRSCDPGVWYLGYSLVGEVVEIGSEVTKVSVGDNVYINASHQSEHVVDQNEAVVLPNGLNPKYGIFLTNLLTAFNGILDSDIKLGDTVVIMGQGVIGQLLSQLARLSGAEVYTVDIIPKRLEVSKENGSEEVINSMEIGDVASYIRGKTGNRGADVVIDASGNEKALNEAIRIAAPETAVIVLSWYQGLTTLNLTDEYHHNRITLKCSQANFTRPDLVHIWPFERKLAYCAQLLGKLELGNLITDEVRFEDIQKAYEAIDNKSQDIIQCVLTYQ